MAEHAEAQALKEAAERQQRSARSAVFGAPAPRRPARSDFPPLQARRTRCSLSLQSHKRLLSFMKSCLR